MASVLVAFTILYNLVEAGVSLWAGFTASSVVLVGFGLDSLIETLAAVALAWRLHVERQGADDETVARAERRVHLVVGVTFFLLAAYVSAQAGYVLLGGVEPEESVVGIVLAIASLVIMPLLAWGKLRAAAHLHSDALRAEAKETLACTYLSFAMLLGLVANATWGLTWADPVAALLMVPWLVKEGLEGVRGDDE